MPKNRAEVAEDQPLRDTSYGRRAGSKLIQSGEWIIPKVFIEEMAELMGEDYEMAKKAYDAYNDLVMQHIALEDHINFPYATIGGHTVDPKKLTGAYALGYQGSDITRGGYSNAKSGYPYFKWTEEALECIQTHPAIYFTEWSPQKYTTKAREFRKSAGYPEIPELVGLPEDRITKICHKADSALYGNKTQQQIRKAKAIDKQKAKAKIGTVEASIEEAKSWLREIGLPEDKINVETYDDAQLVLQNKWRSINTAIQITNNRKRNKFHSKKWIEEQKRMREKMDKDKLQEIYAENDYFAFEDLPFQIQKNIIATIQNDYVKKVNETLEEQGHYVSERKLSYMKKKAMDKIEKRLNDTGLMLEEFEKNAKMRQDVLEQLYSNKYYKDIISDTIEKKKIEKGDNIEGQGSISEERAKLKAEQANNEPVKRKRGRPPKKKPLPPESMSSSYIKPEGGVSDSHIIEMQTKKNLEDLSNDFYMTESDKRRAKMLENIYNRLSGKAVGMENVENEEDSNDSEEELIAAMPVKDD